MTARKSTGGCAARKAVAFAAASTMNHFVSEGAGSDGEEMEIEVRSNFDPLALFESSVITDENGKATIPVKLPDSLTSYRYEAMGLAVEFY